MENLQTSARRAQIPGQSVFTGISVIHIIHLHLAFVSLTEPDKPLMI